MQFNLNTIPFFIFLIGMLNSRVSRAQMDTDHPMRLYMDRFNIFQGRSSEFRGTIQAHGDAAVNSNAITNSFVKGLFFQGHLDDQPKDDVSEKIKKNNRLGYDFNLGVTGTYHRQDLTFIAGVHYRETFNARFSRDAFEVMFRGNKGYAGKLADLSNTQINYFSYQSIFLGLSKQLDSSNYILGAGISVLNGTEYQQLNIRRGNLYTAIDGEYLDVDAAFNLSYSKNKWQTTPFGNGLGLAGNLSLSHWGEKSRWNIEMKDFGFMSWKNVVTSSADSSFRYEGIEVNNILDYHNYTFQGLNTDSLKKQYHIKDRNSTTTQWVPFTIQANYSYLHSDKVHFTLGAKYLALSNFIPRIYFKTLFFHRDHLMLSPAIYLGGYGTFNLELSAVKSFKNRLLVSGSIVCLEYFILPSESHGLGAQLALSKVF